MDDFQNIEQELTAPIDDYLLSIADSLKQVQQQLNHSKVLSVDGQSFTTYQLPKLEFELKMSIHLDNTDVVEAQPRPIIMARPLSVMNSSTNATHKVEASTIKGVFVAVPSDLGAPPPIIRTAVQQIGTGYQVIVSVRSTVGGFLSGVAVHFNIDYDLTSQLNGKAVKSEQVAMKHGIQLTDEQGLAASPITIDAGGIASVAVIVDVLGKTETVVVDYSFSQEKKTN